MLFLHGWGLSHRSYRHALARLREVGSRVHAPALPGFGGTDALPSDSFTLEGYADWVAEFLDEVGVDEPVFCVGHSFGGGVAIQLAVRHPERVRSLVLVNSIGGATWQRDDGDSPAISMAERPWWDWGIHFPRDVLPTREAVRVVPTILRETVPNLVESPLAMWRAGKLARTADLTEELEELKRRRLPVVVLWGARDKLIPRESFDDLCAAIGSEGEVVEGSHAWLLADPDAFGEVITNHVEVAQLARRLDQSKWRFWRGAA